MADETCEPERATVSTQDSGTRSSRGDDQNDGSSPSSPHEHVTQCDITYNLPSQSPAPTPTYPSGRMYHTHPCFDTINIISHFFSWCTSTALANPGSPSHFSFFLLMSSMRKRVRNAALDVLIVTYADEMRYSSPTLVKKHTHPGKYGWLPSYKRGPPILTVQ